MASAKTDMDDRPALGPTVRLLTSSSLDDSALIADLTAVQQIESKCQIDWHQLERDIAKHECGTREASVFHDRGGLSSINSIDTYKAILNDGFVAIAELVLQDGSAIPVGFQYGLWSQPENGTRYPQFAVDSLDMDLRRQTIAAKFADQTMCGWRIAVLPGYQGRKIASLLRHAVFSSAVARGKLFVTANIGGISVSKGAPVAWWNGRSMCQSRKIYRHWAERRHVDVFHLPSGRPVYFHWKAFRNRLTTALRVLKADLCETGEILNLQSQGRFNRFQ